MILGNRIIYDQDGDILLQTGEMEGDVVPRKEITELNFIDLDYGAINIQTHRIVGINPQTKQLILEEVQPIITPEEQRIRNLEDALLLATDNEIGGIL